MKNELQVFTNEEFGNVRVVTINGDGWLVGKDVVETLGYDLSTNRYGIYISKYVDEEDYMLLNKNSLTFQNEHGFNYKELGQRGGYLINSRGLSSLMFGTENLSYEKRYDLTEWFKSIGFLKGITINTRKEIDFLNMLEKTLEPFGLVGKSQYKVLNYKIDYYIPDLNIAIEYDENNHSSYSYESHELRQKLIEEELGCRFIRISDNKSKEYNVGLVIKELFNIGKVA